jgi:hypothetical protein
MPSIHSRTTVDASAEDVYAALATQDGLAGNWTDKLEVPEQTGGGATDSGDASTYQTARISHW